MRIPATVCVLALGAFALITTELGAIGILPQVAEAFGITIDRAGWLLSAFALVIALVGPWMTLRAAPGAPEFSNSLFNSFGNLGLMGGTMLVGLFIVMF
jgi:predicted MFS family arabinose efflux permease